MAWLPGYAYRKPLVLTGGSSGAQTDFQLDIDIAYVAAKMQADFDDIRFTRNDGTTLIDAWLESKVDSASAKTWAEFPTTPANTVEQTYYMYYGKVVANYWDGIATFVKYADKDDYSTYFNSNGASVVGDYIRLGVAGTDSYGTNYLLAISALDRTAQGYVANFKLKGTGTDPNEDEAFFGFATNNGLTNPKCDFAFASGTTLYSYEDSAGTNIDTITWTDEIEYKLEYPQNIGAKYYVDGVLKRNNTTYANDPGKVRITPYSGPVDIKHIFVRKYAANQPTYAFGSEESAPATVVKPPRVFYGPFIGPFGGPIQ